MLQIDNRTVLRLVRGETELYSIDPSQYVDAGVTLVSTAVVSADTGIAVSIIDPTHFKISAPTAGSYNVELSHNFDSGQVRVSRFRVVVANAMTGFHEPLMLPVTIDDLAIALGLADRDYCDFRPLLESSIVVACGIVTRHTGYVFGRRFVLRTVHRRYTGSLGHETGMLLGMWPVWQVKPTSSLASDNDLKITVRPDNDPTIEKPQAWLDVRYPKYPVDVVVDCGSDDPAPDQIRHAVLMLAVMQYRFVTSDTVTVFDPKPILMSLPASGEVVA